MNRFHYIIAGAGCAGLSLLVRMLQSGQFTGKKILLIDKAPKTANDRTWCFWEKQPGFFEPIVHKSWQQLWFHGTAHSGLHNIHPYTYKMIRGIDFYQYCFHIIRKHPDVTIEYANVKRIDNKGDHAVLETDQQYYEADHIFSSIPVDKPSPGKREYYLLQHFKGWVITTPQPVFNPAEATIMDFRVSQEQGTAFVYVMPFTANSALVEYTVFSDQVLAPAEYDKALKTYLSNLLTINDYNIVEEESGAIPMTNVRFAADNGAVTFLGTAGGQTKASSGYTFQFIQKQTAQLVNAMANKKKHLVNQHFLNKRFQWYDGILLNILSQHKLPGAFIFTELFKKNKATAILQFLDNETSLLQEMSIITVLPKRVFIRAAFQQLL